jgi:hypothetical protein
MLARKWTLLVDVAMGMETPREAFSQATAGTGQERLKLCRRGKVHGRMNPDSQ